MLEQAFHRTLFRRVPLESSHVDSVSTHSQNTETKNDSKSRAGRLWLPSSRQSALETDSQFGAVRHITWVEDGRAALLFPIELSPSYPNRQKSWNRVPGETAFKNEKRNSLYSTVGRAGVVRAVAYALREVCAGGLAQDVPGGRGGDSLALCARAHFAGAALCSGTLQDLGAHAHRPTRQSARRPQLEAFFTDLI